MSREVFVLSSQIVVSREPLVLTTVVGSCVAVCLYDHVHRVGGMNHFLLPHADSASRLGLPLGKYGDVAIPELLRRLETLGADRSTTVAKIAGGASILSISSHNHIPDENVRSARAALALLGLPVVSQDVGGTKGRKVVFTTDSGQVTVNGERRL